MIWTVLGRTNQELCRKSLSWGAVWCLSYSLAGAMGLGRETSEVKGLLAAGCVTHRCGRPLSLVRWGPPPPQPRGDDLRSCSFRSTCNIYSEFPLERVGNLSSLHLRESNLGKDQGRLAGDVQAPGWPVSRA